MQLTILHNLPQFTSDLILNSTNHERDMDEIKGIAGFVKNKIPNTISTKNPSGGKKLLKDVKKEIETNASKMGFSEYVCYIDPDSNSGIYFLGK